MKLIKGVNLEPNCQAATKVVKQVNNCNRKMEIQKVCE